MGKKKCEHEFQHYETRDSEFIKHINMPQPCCEQCWKCATVIKCTQHGEKSEA